MARDLVMQNIIRQSENNKQLPYQWLGRKEYTCFLEEMQNRTAAVIISSQQEMIYFCEHEDVYTTGRRGINNSKTNLGAPLIQTERGGETTYHGIGQLMMYPVISLKQHGLSVREYVHMLEQSCINLLAQYDIQTERDCGLPGVWINREKIAALGIRVSKGVASHGIALNVSTDLKWFEKINPCGTSRKATSMLVQGVSELNLEVIAKQWNVTFQQLLLSKTV
ncbi:MAG: lipoyl(octanoyl) transferase LipB [Ghiorsea sp.]